MTPKALSRVNPEWKAHKLLFPKRDYSYSWVFIVVAVVALLICAIN